MSSTTTTTTTFVVIAAEDNYLPPLRIGLIHYTVPNLPTMDPYVPSAIEAEFYYYGLPSKPRLIARSSYDIWIVPTGPEAYLDPKECILVGPHPLN